MKALQELIEMSREQGFGLGPAADDAEAELKELEAGDTAMAMVQRDAYRSLLREASSRAAERDQADAELLEALRARGYHSEVTRRVLERWVATKRGDM